MLPAKEDRALQTRSSAWPLLAGASASYPRPGQGGQETLSKAGGAVSQFPGWDEERTLQAAPSSIHPSLGPHLDCVLLTWPCTLIPAHRQEPSAPGVSKAESCDYNRGWKASARACVKSHCTRPRWQQLESPGSACVGCRLLTPLQLWRKALGARGLADLLRRRLLFPVPLARRRY